MNYEIIIIGFHFSFITIDYYCTTQNIVYKTSVYMITSIDYRKKNQCKDNKAKVLIVLSRNKYNPARLIIKIRREKRVITIRL